MVRQIIKIDEELCNGCGLCVTACHEDAIGIVEGKAKLLRDDYCDGLGNCLPVCPTGALSFEVREALAFNEEEVKKNMERKKLEEANSKTMGCPGSRMMNLQKDKVQEEVSLDTSSTPMASMLRQWPVQIQLVPANAPYFDGADLLVAADCTAYAFANFHSFMKDKITLIGCPKLDEADYGEKLTQIIKNNNINSITVIRMEVPCCGGMVEAVKTAILNSGKLIPWRRVTLSTEGTILEDTK
ncbi:ATP-binding protein [Herbinix luporum]|jgi:Fe-S-cluster-containing hydrogenase component 2|uniref:ATP-binding protein n=1 Tax=Herbinix luporum TaxID=1679721 RepID=UPI0017541E75|nr:4Fe-4S binding protein [Herbinix luporum]MDI9488412.1 4Fe-4S binding protein [Bacillota bacterium]HHT56796.1 4Fe-4S binding protein [Herbinix luporum]